LYAAPGIADSVSFTLHPAIRWGQPKVDQCANDTFACPDEPCGCPHTKWLLCGMHATNTTQTQQVNFLTCFDQNDVAWSNEWVTSGQMPTAKTSALHCVNQSVGLNYKAVQECGDGKMGTDLQHTALKYFEKTFPMYMTGGRFDVPHIYINNVEQTVNLPGKVWTFLQTLCDLGAGAGACKALSDSSSLTPPKLSAEVLTV